MTKLVLVAMAEEVEEVAGTAVARVTVLTLH
jgi:hypothetical protein